MCPVCSFGYIFLSGCFIPGTVLGTEDTEEIQHIAVREEISLVGGTDE